jgi:catechol 2,3-dioxygenase-like lactoylglutathione lyase family enzyme
MIGHPGIVLAKSPSGIGNPRERARESRSVSRVGGDLELLAAVIFVHELQRSADFYRDVLKLETETASASAVVLTAQARDHLVLRALPRAQRMTGNVGVQYLIWTARDEGDLVRVEEALKGRGAFVSTTSEQGVKVVEGHDPDNIPLLVVYPARSEAGLTAVPARIYAY